MDLNTRKRALKQFEKLLQRVHGSKNPGTTVEQAYQRLFKTRWAQARYKKSGWDKNVMQIYRDYVGPEFGHRIIDTISRREVRNWHFNMLHIPVWANRSLSILTSICVYAMEQELAETNPTFAVKKFPEKKRKTFATPEQIAHIGRILRGYINDHRMGKRKERNQALLLFAQLVTGARPRSLENAIWKELTVSGDGIGKLTFDGKGTSDSGEQESVIFPKELMDLLPPPEMRSDYRLIFEDVDSARMWKRIIKEVGCQDLWARDLRRTFATVGLSSGISIELIGEVLNHKDLNSTKVYAKAFEGTKKTASLKISNEILKLF